MCEENELKRLSPEKPYGVLQQFMWRAGGSNGFRSWQTEEKLCSKLRTFATHKEALDHAQAQSERYPRLVFFVIGATERIVTEPPAPPKGTTTVSKLRPSRRARR